MMEKNQQYNKDNSNDENTFDDNLLLMADSSGEKIPLLKITDDGLAKGHAVLSNDNPFRPGSPVLHCHVPDEKFDYSARNRLIIAFILSFTFMIIEIVGAVISNSTALGTDAVHMCIDSASFLISLTAIYLSRKRPTQTLSFGYARAEVLGALVSVLTIWVATGFLIYIAAERCINQDFVVNPDAMIIVASCGIIFNIIMFVVLHPGTCGGSTSHGHSHGSNHGHSHDTNENLSKEDISDQLLPSKNINVKAAMVHVIGDFVQSIGVLIAAILIKVNPEYKLADPICTFLFSILVLITTITIMIDIVHVLMEGVPSNVNYTKIIDDLLRLPGVRNAHSLHIWSLSLQETALSVHIAIDGDRDYLIVLNEVQEMLRREYSIIRTTIQVEPYEEQIMNSCESCQRIDT